MSPSNIIKIIKRCYEKRQAVMIWGPPGIGKSSIVYQAFVNDMKIGLRELRLLYYDPVDLRGCFYVVDGKAAWLPPSFLPTEGQGVIFLDELPAAPRAVQTAAYQLAHDRAIADYKLPDGWSVIAAGNGTSDKAVSNAMPSPLVSRFLHLDLTVSSEDWLNWALTAGIHPLIIAFIKVRPELLYDFNPKDWIQNSPYASPRTWEYLSRFMPSENEQNILNIIDIEVIRGFIGDAAGTEFYAFVKNTQDIPTAEEIIANPKKAKIPETPAGKYAVVAALAKKATVENIGKIISYLERLDKEFEVCGFRDACRLNTDLIKTEEYSKWAIKNMHAIS
jgi:hypothetical protein